MRDTPALPQYFKIILIIGGFQRFPLSCFLKLKSLLSQDPIFRNPLNQIQKSIKSDCISIQIASLFRLHLYSDCISVQIVSILTRFIVIISVLKVRKSCKKSILSKQQNVKTVIRMTSYLEEQLERREEHWYYCCCLLVDESLLYVS